MTLLHQTQGSDAISLVDRLDRLYPAAVSDVLDRMGYRQQAMAPEIRPLFPEARLCGAARPVLAVPCYSVPEKDAYQRELEAVDRLGPGDVMVVSHINGSFWGEVAPRTGVLGSVSSHLTPPEG